jgi:hypothetical protein
MTVRKLDRQEWHPFLDLLSKTLQGKRAEIEVASLALGDQVEAEWLPLLGIVYDPKDDLVEVVLDGLDHLIPQPRDIYIDDFVGGMTSIEIIEEDGIHQIIKLKEPLMLPAPHA